MANLMLIRLRASKIPWLQHFTIIALAFHLFDTNELQAFFILYGLTAILFDTEELLKAIQDPAEPPLIPHPYLPFLGHVFGMFWYGAEYFELVNRKTKYPIFTLQTLTRKTVGVIDPILAAPIQRASRNLSFYGMILEVTRRLVDFDEQSMQIIRWNLDGEHGSGEGLMHESSRMVAGELSPGPSLNQLSTTQLDKFSELLNDLVPENQKLDIGLMELVKRVFTVANAYTIHGPQNPFALYPELVQKFWDYEGGMIAVMADILPWITARKPWLAREAINNALHEFIDEEHYRTASPMIQKRVAINLKHGLTPKMAGHSELILLFGVIGNAVPTTFWFLANVFARPELLNKIREETAQAITHERGKHEKVINVTDLKTKCPLLISTYRETLRTIANLASVRLVTNTHTVQAPGHPSYLLRQGSMVQIASGIIHSLKSVWGDDAETFNPERFISHTTTLEQFHFETREGSSIERTATMLPKNVPSAAYRAFGGGSVICPGRHFAQSEILGFVSLCVNMFEITNRNGSAIRLPEKDNKRIPLSVMKPVEEPQVVVQRRVGEEYVVWKLHL